MLLAVHQGTFDVVCHACGVGSKDVDIKKIQVVDLRKVDATTDSFHFQWECPFCTATESWPDNHSDLVRELQKQLGL